MKLEDFNFNLPDELIAQKPSQRRDDSRLLVLKKDKETNCITHKKFKDIIDYLNPNDLLIFNNTKVIPARIFGRKDTGAKVEVLLVRKVDEYSWECLAKPGKKLKKNTVIKFPQDITGEITGDTDFGGKVIKFNFPYDEFMEKLKGAGELPLPPYIKEKPDDQNRYQTVYAQKPGAVAAPTAGLHFTNELFERIKEKGIVTAFVTLHVGLGTFMPVQVENVLEHKMHSEFYSINEETAKLINQTKKKGGRVIAVGTTVVRTLETAASLNQEIKPSSGWTDIFIYPGYEFKAIDALITNFHLPKSTLMMLVSALATKDKIDLAYQEAVKERYRFFSFGDSMFIS
ncbi:tRNA preQ1(34) S-adenosylmethionine ribosyltransferase-isomerase QueA [Proteinivorax hydrogeniformans]|uniref:S-adenosylmethionine:tRNA ribosyltransferase-isomerase n=1 Tax=Proteinivorax hydrogeniformans TaxID=1826727 RepID=A0AAU8HR68_9FIRM